MVPVLDAIVLSNVVATARPSSHIPSSVIAVSGLLFCAAAWVLIPRWWRSGMRGDLFFSEHLNRAFMANIVMLSGLTLVVSVAAVEESGWVSARVATSMALMFAAVSALAVIMIGTIYLFNWPKFLVPPRMRNQPGRIRAHRSANTIGLPERANREARRRRR